MISNFSQFKKAIQEKKRFKIIEHNIKPEFIGQVRLPNVIQTNGFYSVIDGEPENPLSQVNYGKGLWCEFGKASEWKFENGKCSRIRRGQLYNDDNVMFTFEFID